jgi:hypothetical protein
MSLENQSNLAIILKRIYGTGPQQKPLVVPGLSPEHAWVEAFLSHWVHDEEGFFRIALEKEEKDAYVPSRLLLSHSQVVFSAIARPSQSI